MENFRLSSPAKNNTRKFLLYTLASGIETAEYRLQTAAIFA